MTVIHPRLFVHFRKTENERIFRLRTILLALLEQICVAALECYVRTRNCPTTQHATVLKMQSLFTQEFTFVYFLLTLDVWFARQSKRNLH